VGREDELAAVRAFLQASPFGVSAVLLEGEAGIGKTTLWAAGIGLARERGYRVLSCRPAESEVQFAFGALADLLGDSLAEALCELPEPQRHALEVALLLADPGEQPVDHRAVAMGFLTSLRHLANAKPLLIAIDDVQWLDSSSTRVLEYAFRRLPRQRIALLLTVRSSEVVEVPFGLDRALDRERLTRLRVGPLSLGALHRLLVESLGTAFARPLLQRLLETSGGNPFFALELASALEQSGAVGEGGELPLTRRLDELLHRRIAALPGDVQEVLVMAALLAAPSVSVLQRATGRNTELELEQAGAAGVVVVEHGRIRFSHPLLAAACLAYLDRSRRSELHRRLARVVDGTEACARHLALAADEPDSELATLLEDAAGEALARGGWLAAGDLLGHARRLTPSREVRSWARRSTMLADLLYHHGDQHSALAVADEVIENAEPGKERALALALSSLYVPMRTDRFGQALAEAGDDSALRARIGLMAAITLSGADLRECAAESEDALENARRANDRELILQTMSVAAVHLIWTNESVKIDRARTYLVEAAAIEERLRIRKKQGLLSWSPKSISGSLATWEDDLDRARRLFGDEYVRAAEAGDDKALNRILINIADAEWRSGNFDRSMSSAKEAYDVADRNGDPQARACALYHLAAAQAIVGPLAESRTTIEQAVLQLWSGDRLNLAFCRVVAALVESCAGDHAAVLREVGALPDELDAGGSHNPASRLWFCLGDEIEARIALGDLDLARLRVDRLVERSRRPHWRRPLGIALRGRGLLLAAEGDLPRAFEAFTASLAELEGIPAPFERARSLLSLGTVQRRAKRKRAARESLQASLALFDELGARPWAEKAREELARIGGRAPRAGALTPTERRVAALVAEGRSNREVAAALFVAPRTVEWNLTKIYAKLGVSSRAELAHRWTREARVP
jgi:DNA-binding CsgD family transcriptional regulator